MLSELFAESTNERSLGHAARLKRMGMLTERFPDFASMRIVDLGGDVRFWKAMTVRPAHVTIVALEPWSIQDLEPWMSGIVGDACVRSAFTGNYDLAFSNSVIEHVGGPRFRRGFAETVLGLAPHYWVQTPNRYFPLEPHFMFPGFQFLPPAAKVVIAKRWKFSRLKQHPEFREPVEYVMDHELVTATELRALFPGTTILRERSLGLTKSLVATG